MQDQLLDRKTKTRNTGDFNNAKSLSLLAQAKKFIPGGVSSANRSVSPQLVFVKWVLN
jgi:hypothetical protein